MTREPEWFWQFVEVGEPDECWEWTFRMTESGYGYCHYQGKAFTASRVAYILTYGEPVGKHVHHTCENKKCVNPCHLEAVTNREHGALH